MLLKTLKSIVRPKKQTEPFELAPSDLARLRDLRSHPHWDTYLKLLDKLTSFLAEDMLNTSDVQAVLHYRSAILGVRRAGTLVDELIKADEAKDARQRDREHTRRNLDESRAIATFGTPYWG